MAIKLYSMDEALDILDKDRSIYGIRPLCWDSETEKPLLRLIDVREHQQYVVEDEITGVQYKLGLTICNPNDRYHKWYIIKEKSNVNLR